MLSDPETKPIEPETDCQELQALASEDKLPNDGTYEPYPIIEQVVWIGTANQTVLHIIKFSSSLFDAKHGREVDPTKTTIFVHLSSVCSSLYHSPPRASSLHFPFRSSVPVLGPPRS